MRFLEEIIIEGTKHQGLDLIGYSFGIACMFMLIVVPLVILVRLCEILYYVVFAQQNNKDSHITKSNNGAK